MTPGGIGQVVASIARRLSDKGHAVSLVFSPLADPPPGDLFGALSDVEVVPLGSKVPRPERFSLDPRLRQLRIALAIRRLHARRSVDVLEVPDYHGIGAGWLAGRALRLVGSTLPTAVVRLHGPSQIVREVEGRPGSELSQAIERRERRTLSLADAWVAPSHQIGDLYRERYAIANVPIVAAPLPIEIPVTTCHPRGVPPANGGRVLFYGRLQTVKGADVFVRAAVEILRARPSASFTLVGADVRIEGNESMKEILLASIPAANRAAFTFKGRIERNDLRALALAHDVAVVPSRSETFCLAAHELNAIGIPLVLRRLPAFDAYFQNGRTAKLFESDLDLAAATMQVLGGEAAAWDWNARVIADEADDVEGLYTRLLIAGRRQR